ncbi:MAG: hypothetical protein WCR86_12405 [Parabacteroides sp.]
MMREFSNTTIVVPKGMMMVDGQSLKPFKDTSLKAKLIFYFDESSCSSCQVAHLSDLLNLYEIGDKSGKYEVLIIFSPPHEDLSGLIEELKLRDFEHPVIVDSNKEFEIGNPSMPSDNRFHTYLIDEKGLPLFIGNPNGSEELYGLFMKAVSRLK